MFSKDELGPFNYVLSYNVHEKSESLTRNMALKSETARHYQPIRKQDSKRHVVAGKTGKIDK